MSIFGSLRNTINTLDVLSQALDLTQNNIANVSTPGYARHTLQFIARPFELGSLPGGVSAGELQSTRQDYAERSVRQQVETLGKMDVSKDLLANLEQVFDISGKTGVAAELSGLFASFSAWSVRPNDVGARRSVMSSMQQVAQAFNATASAISDQAANVERRTQSTLGEINRLVGVLRDINVGRRSLTSPDAGMEARLYNTLEELSRLVNFTASFEEDGTVSLSLAGRYPLLLGDHQTQLSISYDQPDDATYSGGLPPAHLLSGERDLTEMVSGGELAALMSFRNQTVPSLIGGPYALGELNQLASTFAGRVNAISTAAGGPALFAYDAASPVRAAVTLRVAPGVTDADLVAAGSAGNDVALALAQLSNSQASADKIDSLSYTGFFAQMIGRIGSESAEAAKAADVQEDILTQSKTLRASVSGVSLDEEAVKLVEYQRSYQAMARMTNVLNELSETILTLLR